MRDNLTKLNFKTIFFLFQLKIVWKIKTSAEKKTGLKIMCDFSHEINNELIFQSVMNY